MSRNLFKHIVMNWYLKALKQYADFKGRSRRKEYWMFLLVNMMVAFILIVLDNLLGLASETLGYGPLYGVYLLATILPGLALSVRRLHDIGKSGWMLLIVLIPLIGGIWLIVLMAKEGEAAENKYGINPKEVVAA